MDDTTMCARCRRQMFRAGMVQLGNDYVCGQYNADACAKLAPGAAAYRKRVAGAVRDAINPTDSAPSRATSKFPDRS